MKVWVLWYTTGPVTGVLDVATEENVRGKISGAARELRARYGVDGEFTRVRNKEPYFRDDEHVYRCGGLTLIARPFTLGEAT